MKRSQDLRRAKGNYEGKETKKTNPPPKKKKKKKRKQKIENRKQWVRPAVLDVLLRSICAAIARKKNVFLYSLPSPSFGAKKIRKIPQFFLPLLSLSEVREIAALSYITPGRSVRMAFRGGEQ